MSDFKPELIYLDGEVANTPLSKRVLAFFSGIPVTHIDDPASVKQTGTHTLAKRKLLITKHKGQAIKACQGLSNDYVCCNLLTLSLASNCHFECSYCILQDYLKNNPIMTFYANVDEILGELEAKIKNSPETLFRVGTGELADSLALDHITGYSKDLVEFAARQKNLVIELKTKSNNVAGLLNLDHQRKTVVSWSINPQSFIDKEEYKTASLDERFAAARLCADAGYLVGFHLDPLLNLENWEEEYKSLVKKMSRLFDEDEIAWISSGSLRYTPGLAPIAKKRFPKSRLFYGELFPNEDGKVRYFRPIREEMSTKVSGLIKENFPDTPHYLCMETEKIWQKVFKNRPATTTVLEEQISARFAI